jgi:hypothetical protein
MTAWQKPKILEELAMNAENWRSAFRDQKEIRMKPSSWYSTALSRRSSKMPASGH